jgi:hypothetical protein
MQDIYQIGKVLDKKYVNLRLSYLSLGAGIIISAISFSTQHLGRLMTRSSNAHKHGNS